MIRQLWIFIAQMMVFTLVFSLLMRGAVPFPFDVFLGFVGAVALIYALSAIREVMSIFADMRLVRRANSGIVAKDGERFSAVGRLQPIGAPLRAPFSRRECVYYQYAATSSDATAKGEPVAGEYSGLALTRCNVRSPVRETRLFGIPTIKGFEDQTERLTWEEHFENAERYVAATTFEIASTGDIATIFQVIRSTFQDEDGQIRRDVRLDQARPIREMTLLETIVPTGVEVCAVGTWSSDHGGLVQRFGTREMLTLYAGGAEGAVAELRRSVKTYVIGASVGLAITLGLGIVRLMLS